MRFLPSFLLILTITPTFALLSTPSFIESSAQSSNIHVSVSVDLDEGRSSTVHIPHRQHSHSASHSPSPSSSSASISSISSTTPPIGVIPTILHPSSHVPTPEHDYETEYNISFDEAQKVLSSGNATIIKYQSNNPNSHSLPPHAVAFVSLASMVDPDILNDSPLIITSTHALSLDNLYHVFCQKFDKFYKSNADLTKSKKFFSTSVNSIVKWNNDLRKSLQGMTPSTDEDTSSFKKFHTGLIVPKNYHSRPQCRWWDGASQHHEPKEGYEELGLIPADSSSNAQLLGGNGNTVVTDPNNPQCNALHGTCMAANKCSSGKTVSGKCKGTGSIKCCLPKTTGGGQGGNPVVKPAWLTSHTVDWVAKGVLNPIRNQNKCSSCYSFSAIATVEAALAIATSSPPATFSDQAGVDCTTQSPYSNIQCNGGWYGSVWDWMLAIEDKSDHDQAVPFLKDYPYTGTNEACNSQQLATRSSSSAYLTGYMNVAANDVAAIMAAVDLGPVSASVYSECPEFRSYISGIIMDAHGDCAMQGVDHAINIVGYGLMADGTPYWKVRNSWGEGWGYKGYGFIQRGKNTLRIETFVSAVHVDIKA